MPIITLTTEWGTRDHYVGTLKGSILSRCPGATIVDICHDITPFDMSRAAYIFGSAWRNFPEGTVHFIGLNSGTNDEQDYLLVKSSGHYFTGSDSGFFSLVLDAPPEKMVKLATGAAISGNNYDAMVKAVCGILAGEEMEVQGVPVHEYEQKSLLQPVVEEKVVRGTAIYIDEFGNVVSNIRRDLFDSVCSGRQFSIYLRKHEYHLNQISSRYDAVEEGEIVALFNASGFLEIAMNRSRAAQLLGLKVGDYIRIDFV